VVVTSALLVIRSATEASERKNGSTNTKFDKTTNNNRIARTRERSVNVDFLSLVRCNIDFLGC